jgi:hypothetical protein
MFQREQRRLRAAMNCLINDAPNARAINPDAYESLIPVYNDLVGARGAFYEQEVWSSTDLDFGVYKALSTFTNEVFDFIQRVRQLTNCDAAVAAAGGEGGVAPSAPQPEPAPAESLLTPTPSAPPEPGSGDVPRLVPVVTPPGPRRTTTSGFPSWTYYAFAGTGVLLAVGIVGFLFFKRRRNITPKARRLTAG